MLSRRLDRTRVQFADIEQSIQQIGHGGDRKLLLFHRLQ